MGHAHFYLKDFVRFSSFLFRMCVLFSFFSFIIIATSLSQFSTATVASAYVYFWSIFFLQFLFWGRRLQIFSSSLRILFIAVLLRFSYILYISYINNVFQGHFTDNHRTVCHTFLKQGIECTQIWYNNTMCSVVIRNNNSLLYESFQAKTISYLIALR